MSQQKEQSTFLIKSSQNRSFGTGFCIYHDGGGSYIVTCAHVVDECGTEAMLIEGRAVQLKAKGDSRLLDLALLYVERLDAIPLEVNLDRHLQEALTPFEISGFKPHKQDSYKLETIDGSIEKISTVYTAIGSMDTYELTINGNDSIEKGYSGSAVISTKNNLVIAVSTDRNRSGKEAYATPIYHLKSIWRDMPQRLLSQEVVIEEHSSPKSVPQKIGKLDFLLPFGLILALLIFITNRIYPHLDLGEIIYVLLLVSLLLSGLFVYLKRKIKEWL
jgi:S1-C subfamily serine protease